MLFKTAIRRELLKWGRRRIKLLCKSTNPNPISNWNRRQSGRQNPFIATRSEYNLYNRPRLPRLFRPLHRTRVSSSAGFKVAMTPQCLVALTAPSTVVTVSARKKAARSVRKARLVSALLMEVDGVARSLDATRVRVISFSAQPTVAESDAPMMDAPSLQWVAPVYVQHMVVVARSTSMAIAQSGRVSDGVCSGVWKTDSFTGWAHWV